jgi:plasmid stability protein
MASLTLKDLPDTLLNQLRTRARQERRSMTQQAIVLLEEALIHQEAANQTVGVRQQQVAIWREVAGRWTSSQTVDEEVAGIYSARSEGRQVEL